MIKIYTDGACRNVRSKQNKGGWGVVIRDTDTGKELHKWGHTANTTNNRMEMLAAVKALHLIRNRERSTVNLYSDSNLLIKGMTEWLDGWKRNGWRNAKRKPVENSDLWKQLDELSALHNVTWSHVKGHAGHPDNELADALANRGADGHNGSKSL